MKTPKRIAPLVEDGLVDEVIRQLMSGKEATVYVVRCGDEIRCAKVYKEADKRSFRQSAVYTEGRKVKNSRRARAMEKGTSYGRKAQEEAPRWMPCIGWLRRVCGCRNRITSMKACC
jgi:RIO kinase 1